MDTLQTPKTPLKIKKIKILGDAVVDGGSRGVWAPYFPTIEGCLLAPVWVGGMGEAAKLHSSLVFDHIRID